MKNLKHVLMALLILGSFTGCFLDDDNTFYTAPQNESNVTNQNSDANNNNDGNDNADNADNETGQGSNTQTQFASDLQTVLSQNEDDEPLEITDTTDESSSFNTLL
jgi:hypothetical protein